MIIGAGQQFPRNNSHCKLLCHFEADASDSSVGHSETHTPTVNGSPSYGAGKFGNCIDFGSSDTSKYVTFPDSTDWDFIAGELGTISIWVYFNTINQYNPIISRNNADGTRAVTYIEYRSQDTPIRFLVNCYGQAMYANVELSASQWYHIGCSNNGSRAYFSVNGIIINSMNTAATSVSSDKTLNIGVNRLLGGQSLAKFDEFAWIKGECLWTRNFDPPNRAS
jgi:hypothetical protein